MGELHMPNKVLNSRVSKSPFKDYAPVTDTEQLVQEQMRPGDAVFIKKLEIKPSEQRRIPLGSFAEEETLRGFLVEVNPDPMPVKSLATKITRHGDGDRYALYLHVANHGKKSLQLEVWRL